MELELSTIGEMGSQAKRKGRILVQEIGEEDLVSRLPHELIHKVLSFVDAKVAVQTSALSRRWKFIWSIFPSSISVGMETIHIKTFIS